MSSQAAGIIGFGVPSMFIGTHGSADSGSVLRDHMVVAEVGPLILELPPEDLGVELCRGLEFVAGVIDPDGLSFAKITQALRLLIIAVDGA